MKVSWISILSHTPGVWLKIEIQQLIFSSDAKKTSDRRPRTSAANTSSKAFVRRRKWTNYLLSFRVYAFQLADFSAEKWTSQNVSADVCGSLQKTSADTEIFFSVNLSICAKPLGPAPYLPLCFTEICVYLLPNAPSWEWPWLPCLSVFCWASLSFPQPWRFLRYCAGNWCLSCVGEWNWGNKVLKHSYVLFFVHSQI